MTYGGTTTPDLEVHEAQAGAAVVVLQGEHDLGSKDSLHQTLTSVLATHQVVVVDLSSALYIDSSTLGVLVGTDRAARNSGKHFRLQLGSEPIVRRVLEISGLLDRLDWYPTRDQALYTEPIKQPDRLL